MATLRHARTKVVSHAFSSFAKSFTSSAAGEPCGFISSLHVRLREQQFSVVASLSRQSDVTAPSALRPSSAQAQHVSF
eukprot:3562006-Prymnesium_polylepis.1